MLAFPAPISRLARRSAVVIIFTLKQPHCAAVPGVHVELAVIAASRYLHVVLQPEPVEVNDVGKLFVVGAT